MSVTTSMISLSAIKRRLEQYLEKQGFFLRFPIPPSDADIINLLTVTLGHEPSKYDFASLEWETNIDNMRVYITYMRGDVNVYFHIWVDDFTSYHYVSKFNEEKRCFLPPEPTYLPIARIKEGRVDAESV